MSTKIDPMSCTTLALDVGDTRIGLAIGQTFTRLARPFATILNDASLWDILDGHVKRQNVDSFVVGLPRNLSGEDTDQTRQVRRFASQLSVRYKLPVHFQDEALTSRQAESELLARGQAYKKSDIDSLAATLILSDYFNEKSRYDNE